ncbi:MAG: hypothetical protein ABIP94_08070 [Planctomycetota bacterium]
MTDLLAKIDGLRAAGGATAPPLNGAAGTETPSFQKLIDSLERLVAEHRDLPPAKDAEQLQAALRAADDGFVTAMDLRKRLEAAFRGQAT